MAKAPRPTKKRRKKKPELNEDSTDPTNMPDGDADDAEEETEEEDQDTTAEEDSAGEETSEEVSGESEEESEAAAGPEEDPEPPVPTTRATIAPDEPPPVKPEPSLEDEVDARDAASDELPERFQNETLDNDVQAIGDYGSVTVQDFLQITKRRGKGPEARVLLDRYVKAGLVERTWSESSGRYSLTDAGKAHVASLK